MAITKSIATECALAALALLLAGCASTPVPRATRVPPAPAASPAPVRGAGAASTRTARPELSETSGLPDYLAYAALHNPHMEAAFHRWKAALEMVPQVRALPDPRFTYGYFIQEVETRVGPQEQRVGISQTFPWFGKLSLRGDAAVEGARAAQQQYEATKLKLFDEVKQAYFELYYLGRATGIAEENVRWLEYVEQVARAKYETGTARQADVIKAQVEVDRLRDRLRTLRDEKSPAAARLCAALNRPDGVPLPWPAHLPPVHIRTNTPALVQRLLDANPELKRLAFLAEQDKANIALAKKEFYPDVTLGVDYIDTGPARMPGVADSGKDPLVAGVSVNLPLWQGKYRAGVAEAQHRYDATRQEREDRAHTLTAELKRALFQYEDAERKLALYRDALMPKAEEHVHAAQRAFEAGASDLLSLIEAERLRLEFQLACERAAADREQALSTVDVLVGGDPANAADAPPTTEKGPGHGG